jgi:actin related protein 2/3 complex subunit 2
MHPEKPVAMTSKAKSVPSRLLHMETSHPAVLETVRRIVTGENDVAYASVRDFDSCEYQIRVTEDATAIVISIHHHVPAAFFAKNCAAELASILEGDFGKALLAEADEGCAASIAVPLPEDDPTTVVENPLLAKAAALRTSCLAALFVRAVAAHAAKKSFALRVPYRAGESLYLHTTATGVMMATVSIVVPDRADRLLLRTFLIEMAEAKKLGKCKTGPSMSFTLGTATEFPQGLAAGEPADENTFWVNFGLSQRSMSSEADTRRAAEFIINFRAYVLYHMQCARSVMHGRMRERVKTSLTVLNRAKTSTTGKPRISM